VVFTSRSAVLCRICDPTVVPPVKLTMSMPGCSTRYRLASAPAASTLRTPGGSWACSAAAATYWVTRRVSSGSFRITVLPLSSAGSTFMPM
jgi:hypothetical protein